MRLTRLEALRALLKDAPVRAPAVPPRYVLPAPMTLAQWRLMYDAR
jgi:hypothetical protein